MDIFIPEDLHVRQQQANQRQDGTQPAPAKVVFFCHGGIWMFGEKWHHCGLALRMAQAGLVVVAVEYTLYPTATVPQMIDELLLALTWTFANIRQWGGDPHGEQPCICMAAELQSCRAVQLSRGSCCIIFPGCPMPSPVQLCSSSCTQRLLNQALQPVDRCLHTIGGMRRILMTPFACAPLQMCLWWATQQARTW
jgi:hypothetical protein